MSNILIIDDSISVRKALEITLRNHQLQSRSAISAEQALEQSDIIVLLVDHDAFAPLKDQATGLRVIDTRGQWR